MRFSTGILASVLLFNAVYAQESASESVASASFSVESASYQKRDFFDFLTILFPDDDEESSSSASAEDIEPSSSSSASAEAEPSFAGIFEKRDGNMQEVLESLANFYYASASLESAAMEIAREEWSANPEEVASVIAQASRQHKARYMKREDDEDSVSASFSFEEEASSLVEEDAFAPVSQAYLPVYYRRAKRHLELRDLEDDEDVEGDESISEVPDEEPSAFFHSHHHHEESVSNYHFQEQASAEYYEAADNLEKRDEASIEEEASSSAESSLEDIASKIAQDVQDQIDRALGKGKVVYSEQEPMVAESLEDQVWLDDEEQFKGYDWTGSN